MKEQIEIPEGNPPKRKLLLHEQVKSKTAKMNKNNIWLLELIYGDAAFDKTAKFQIPHNIVFRPVKEIKTKNNVLL